MYFGFFSKLYGRSNGLPELLKNLDREKHLIGFAMSNLLDWKKNKNCKKSQL